MGFVLFLQITQLTKVCINQIRVHNPNKQTNIRCGKKGTLSAKQKCDVKNNIKDMQAHSPNRQRQFQHSHQQQLQTSRKH